MKLTRVPPLLAALAALLAGLLLGRLFFGRGAHPADTARAPAAAAAKAAIWTCSMHPQIRQPEPGRCPICGMDLIPVGGDNAAGEGSRTLTMSENAKALAEIQTSPVVRRFPEVPVRLVGKLDFDETRVKSLAARFPARIDTLFVNYTGIRVEQGDHLAVIYSPELLTAQRELLGAVQYDPAGPTAQVARDKLRLLDLQPDQIEEIVASGVARDRFELRAPMGGIVVQKNVSEGDYVETGSPLFRIADLDVLWLPLEAYESDLPWLRYGEKAQFEVESFPGERFEGLIVFIDPLLDPETRTAGVRVEVPNPHGRLKPGMLAHAVVYSRIAAGSRVIAPELAGKWISPMHPEIIKDGPGKCDICGMDLVPIESLGYVTGPVEPPLVVPASAVLRTGKRAVVYLALKDRDVPTYEGREISLGPRAGDVYLVEAGLQEGDEVVTNGAFKIDSSLQIQARPSMMNPAGETPAPAVGHDHGTGQSSGHAAGGASHAGSPAGPAAPGLSAADAQKLLDPYLRLQAALAGDDLAGAKAAAQAMMDAIGHTASVADVLHAMLAADSLAALRRPHFEMLSDAMIAALRTAGQSLTRPVFIKHCPMAGPDGADWLQPGEETRNPYFGSAMLTCGETTGTIGPE